MMHTHWNMNYGEHIMMSTLWWALCGIARIERFARIERTTSPWTFERIARATSSWTFIFCQDLMRFMKFVCWQSKMTGKVRVYCVRMMFDIGEIAWWRRGGCWRSVFMWRHLWRIMPFDVISCLWMACVPCCTLYFLCSCNYTFVDMLESDCRQFYVFWPSDMVLHSCCMNAEHETKNSGKVSSFWTKWKTTNIEK